ncbi:XRE family transcriptional regulator [Actinomadura algeriensis]|uniref:Transcriptional regulator with XRE-family HTH domain n=1 Tax=Actinomadura algeriensis TaxID=1679523 RepID=A0ABR9JUE7_9ACTN|nr:XRE family transcriptional regulator [Actinomadura algeriensis]MBE1534184.1 transcriptional regulator with XRE-family HTH domain [Actinomadura algeriensis]
MSAAEDTVVRNRALQIEWYGEPLGERVRRLLDRLALSQSGLAGVLGLSAPMLSQLMSAQRAKISNPAVLHRLLAVEELAADPRLDELPAAAVKDRLAEIRAESAPTTSGLRVTTGAHASGGTSEDGSGRAAEQAPPARPSVQDGRTRAETGARHVQALLREVASAGEIEAAAALLAGRYPDLAEALRVYGTGRASEAEAHFARTVLRAGLL